MTPDESFRILVREKMDTGLLPRHECSKVLGGPANGEVCDACGEAIPKTELAMECIGERYLRSHLFHVRCFYVWDSEVRALGGPSPGACAT